MNKPGYYESFEEMVHRLTQMQDTAVPGLGGAADTVCKLLRIAYFDARQFRDYRDEQKNEGLCLVLYNNGSSRGEPVSMRFEAENRTITCYHAYPTAGAAPWTETEQQRIQLLIQTVYHFNGRSRLLKLINKFTYFDDFGYRNHRYYIRFANVLNEKGTLTGMTAFHVNLKHFGMVNQQIGRPAGDRVMRQFIDGLQEIIGSTGVICRMGGDNFVILAEKPLTQDILHYLSGTGVVYDQAKHERILISATVGVFEIPENFNMVTESSLMDPIISSSHAARNSRTTDIVFFSQEMISKKQHFMEIQQIFPQALKDGEFLVYYQPKVTIDGKNLGGAEALCRWKRNGKIVPPLEFIPILEAGMEICDLDFYVLDQVCKDIRRWMDQGKRIVRISVNLSRRHIIDLTLLEHILEIIDRNHVPHEYIEVELTETTTDVEFNALQKIVTGLQQEGIFTSVDDFGIGYSSLKLIKEIPWNVLKIDKSFLPETDESSQSRRSVMFRHVILMAQEMGLECITEGVETAEQVGLLTENHCEMAQGFYFDKPLPVEEFEKRLEQIHYEK